MNAETSSCVFTPCPLCGGRGLVVTGRTTMAVCPNGCLARRYGPVCYNDIFTPVVGYGWNPATQTHERNRCEERLP